MENKWWISKITRICMHTHTHACANAHAYAWACAYICEQMHMQQHAAQRLARFTQKKVNFTFFVWMRGAHTHTCMYMSERKLANKANSPIFTTRFIIYEVYDKNMSCKNCHTGPVSPRGGPHPWINISDFIWFIAKIILLVVLELASATIFEKNKMNHGPNQSSNLK